MASKTPNFMKLQIIHGSKKFHVEPRVPHTEAGNPLNVQHLKTAIENVTDIPHNNQRLIYKGKSLTDPQSHLVDFGLKNDCKVMLIGKKPLPEDDANIKRMEAVEKSIDNQEKKLSEITHELDGIHRGYIQDELKGDAIKVLEKRLAGMTEALMKLLENLDSLQFDESSKGARGKRKTLVNKIQVLLDRCDSLSQGLTTMKEKLGPHQPDS